MCDSRERRSRCGAPVVPSLLCALAFGCGSRPDVLLITLDTVRADRVSAYGHERRTTPALDALAAEGVRFDRAYATSSWTVPSVVSILSALHPSTHAIEHGHLVPDGEISAEGVVGQEVVPDAVALLPELLRQGGYRTFGITANAHLDPRFGFARGFDRYRCVGFAGLEAVEEVLDEWRDEIAEAEPSFVWIHLLDPHAPYTPRDQWLRRHRNSARVPEQIRNVVVTLQYADLGLQRGTPLFELVNLLYEGEIEHADAAVGRFLAALGITADDLVIATSDHGEEFLDHDGFGHGGHLYEEVVRVPLILRFPAGSYAGRVVDTPVSAVDLLPTILDAVGLEIPTGLHGRSLLPLLRGQEREPRPILTELARFPELEARALRAGRWKYIRPVAGEPMLFDLERDPGERANLLAQRTQEAARLARSLDALTTAHRAARLEPRLEPLTPEELHQLEALGYVER